MTQAFAQSAKRIQDQAVEAEFPPAEGASAFGIYEYEPTDIVDALRGNGTGYSSFVTMCNRSFLDGAAC